MSSVLDSIVAEYRRYKTLGEGAMVQLGETELSQAADDESNSIAVIVWHVAGNLRSRFTDFLTTDGEKPWRHRDEEFEPRMVGRQELLEKWESGWKVLFDALGTLTDADLTANVTIRGETMPVHAALHRSLAHTSYHVGQIVYIAKAARAARWQVLSIPKGGSSAAGPNPSA